MMRNRSRFAGIAVAAALALLGAGCGNDDDSAADPGGNGVEDDANGAATDEVSMIRVLESGLSGVGPDEPVEGSASVLTRTDDGISSQIRTTTEPGQATTVWYVIFNAPQNCLAACGIGDILVLDDDGLPVMDGEEPVINEDQIEAARISIVTGNDGAVAAEDGSLTLNAHLDVGWTPTGPAQVVGGAAEDDPVLATGPVTGIEDPWTAEIHHVLQSHGPAHDDPDLLEEQLTMFYGACNPDCPDDQYSVHLP